MFWITSEGRVGRVGGGGLVCMIVVVVVVVVVGLMTTLGDVGEVLTCSRGLLCFRALFWCFLVVVDFVSRRAWASFLGRIESLCDTSTIESFDCAQRTSLNRVTASGYGL